MLGANATRVQSLAVEAATLIHAHHRIVRESDWTYGDPLYGAFVDQYRANLEGIIVALAASFRVMDDALIRENNYELKSTFKNYKEMKSHVETRFQIFAPSEQSTKKDCRFAANKIIHSSNHMYFQDPIHNIQLSDSEYISITADSEIVTLENTSEKWNHSIDLLSFTRCVYSISYFDTQERSGDAPPNNLIPIPDQPDPIL